MGFKFLMKENNYYLNKTLNWVFWIVLCLFIYVLTRIGLYELLNMKFHGTDFCLYDNAIWNATYGTWLKCNLSHGYSYLGIHFSPILFLLVPFYWLGAGSWVLILARTAAAVGGAVLIRLYARKYANLPVWVSSLFGISFLLHPLVHQATLSEFHGTILELFFIPLLFVALESEKKWFFWISFFLLLSVREDTWLYTMGLSFLFLWKRDRKLSLQVGLISVVWGVLALAVFVPYFYGGLGNIGHKNAMFSLYLARYRGYSWSHLFQFLKPRLLVDLKLLLPLALLPILGGKYFLLMWIPIIQIQLGRTDLQEYLLIHYPACILPFAYIAGIHGWKKLEDLFKRKKQKNIKVVRAISGVCVLSLSLLFFNNSLVVKKKYLELFTPHLVNLRMRTAYKLLKEIPENASLSLQGSLFHVGSHRKRVYMFSGFPPHAHFPAVKTDYILVDTDRPFVQAKNFRGAIEKLLSGHEYGVVKGEDGFILFKKGYPVLKNAAVLHRYRFRIPGESMHHRTSEGEWNARFDWKAIRMAREKRDKEGIMACGVHRLLGPGIYQAKFAMFLRGIPGWAAASLVVREKDTSGKEVALAHKTIKFSRKKGEIKTVTLRFTLSEKTSVEPVVFYGGHGTVGLDYVEFNRVKGESLR